MADQTQPNPTEELEKVKKAITAQEALLGTGILPDEQIKETLAALRQKQVSLKAELKGSGAIAQGEGATAVGERGIFVGKSAGIAISGDNNSVQAIVHIYQDGAMRSPDPELLRRQIASYLTWMLDRTGTIELRGIKREGQQVVQLDLEAVYVPLAAEAYDPHRRQNQDSLSPEATGPQEISLDEVLSLGPRLIVTGGPGSGKTTVLMHIAYTLTVAIATDEVQLAQEKLGMVGKNVPLPIFVPLSAYATHIRHLPTTASPEARTLAAFISDYLIEKQTSFDLPGDFFKQLLSNGRSVILLLDGLDEVPDEAERVRVRQAIEELVTGREDMRVVVTCRTAAYKDRTALGRGFRELRVKPLDREHVNILISHAYGHIYRHDQAHREQKTAELIDGIERLEGERQRRLGQDIAPLVDSPLMVRLLLVVHYSERRLPEQRAELFMKATDAMLLPEYGPDEVISDQIGRLVGGSREIHRDLVQHLAFQMHSRGADRGREIEEIDLRLLLGENPSYGPMLDDFIALTRLRGTLLEERLGTYRFIHLAFQEYLAARYLAEVVRGEGGVNAIAALLEEGLIMDSWWREPTLLTVGYLGVTSPQTAQAFIRRLAGIDDGATERNADLSADVQMAAAEAASVALLEWQAGPDSLYEALSARLHQLFIDGAMMKRTKPVIRAAVGVALARLGDPRPEVVDVDQMQFCRVPAGLFWMGEDKDEHLNKTLTNDYWLGRFPVTNAQYAAFVEEDGYAIARYWPEAEAARQWVQGKVTKPELRAAPYPFGRPYDLPNHPVVGVNWYEALAYCRWLSERWYESGRLPKGWAVTLPSEAEWEKAARGGLEIPVEILPLTIADIREAMTAEALRQDNPEPKRAYPWVAPEVSPDRANYDETGIGSTNAAGCFPAGASAYGCEELSGNVWEWTRSRIAGYPYEPDDGREVPPEDADKMMAMRGGAYWNDASLLRCCVARPATGSIRTSGTTTSAFGWSCPHCRGLSPGPPLISEGSGL